MRLLEREQECSAAQTLVDDALAGGGGLLVIEGPSGIGKSMLLADLAARASAAGVAVRSVRGTRLGRTTRQIAATLFLSPKTVEGHLTSTFRKLGISSRAELGPRLEPHSDKEIAKR